MVNTKGVRIANDPEFAERLAGHMPEFEVYLQFDSFKPEVLIVLRGKGLTYVRQQALETLRNEVR